MNLGFPEFTLTVRAKDKRVRCTERVRDNKRTKLEKVALIFICYIFATGSKERTKPPIRITLAILNVGSPLGFRAAAECCGGMFRTAAATLALS